MGVPSSDRMMSRALLLLLALIGSSASAFSGSAWIESVNRRFGGGAQKASTAKHDPLHQKTSVASRIVGGTDIGGYKYKFLIGLGRGSSSSFGVSCGGTLIKPIGTNGLANKVLTAAHCFEGTSALNSIPEALFYGYDKSDITGDTCTEVIKIASYKCHPDYSSRTMANDVCMLTLTKEPTCITQNALIYDELPSLDVVDGADSIMLPKTSVTVAGWGTTSSGGSQPNLAQEVTVITESRTTCNHQYNGAIVEGMTCAGILGEAGKDSCQGDSGGPLFKEVDGSYVIGGVVSWGTGCAWRSHLGVYATVSSYKEWITAQAQYSCTDVAGWYDLDGAQYTCDWYASGTHCTNSGDGYANFGFTANQACCACGGGTSADNAITVTMEPTSEPSSVPTTETNSEQSAAPTVGGCQDVLDWHDADGATYTCSWYNSDGDACSNFGAEYEYGSYTANQACCTCGGGSDTGVITMPPTAAAPPSPPPSPSPPPTVPDPIYIGTCGDLKKYYKNNSCCGQLETSLDISIAPMGLGTQYRRELHVPAIKATPVSNKQRLGLYSQFDRNGDGLINREEFMGVITGKYPGANQYLIDIAKQIEASRAN